MRSAPKGLFIIFFIVDIAFIIYWAITYLHLLPPAFLYKDYTNSILVDWNWSFFPIDLRSLSAGKKRACMKRRRASASA